MLGGLLVAAAMVGGFAVAGGAGTGPRGRVVVTRRAIPAGHRILADDLRTEPVDLPPSLAGQVFSSADAVAGSVTVATLSGDEVIVRSAVVSIGGSGPPGREFSFPMDRERAMNGRLQAGESVDLLATYGSGESARTVVVTRGIRLVDLTDAGRATIGSSGKVIVTLQLSDAEEVLEAAHASEVAAVTLVRSTGADAERGTDAFTTPSAGPSPTKTTAVGP